MKMLLYVSCIKIVDATRCGLGGGELSPQNIPVALEIALFGFRKINTIHKFLS